MTINPLSREIDKIRYDNTIVHNTEENFNNSNSGIYIDYTKNLIKLKNSTSNYCWVQFNIPNLVGMSEFYISYEIRNCTGDPVKFSIEKNNVYRYNAYQNKTSEWQKHKTKIIVKDFQEDNNQQDAIIAIGNTANINFSAEIRNIKIDYKSDKIGVYNFIKANTFGLKKVINSFPNGIENNVYKIGKLYKNNTWNSLKILHFSQAMTTLHSFSCWDGDFKYILTYLSLNNVSHFNFYTVDNGDNIDIFMITQRTVLDDELVVLYNTIGKKQELYPIVATTHLPEAAKKITPEIYQIPKVSPANKLNTLYYGEKMKQENVYDDYISYMDEKTLYDKQQRKLEQDRQLAYEEALKTNPELTYEEFMSVQHMVLNLVEEPKPSEKLKQFMDKYL